MESWGFSNCACPQNHSAVRLVRRPCIWAIAVEAKTDTYWKSCGRVRHHSNGMRYQRLCLQQHEARRLANSHAAAVAGWAGSVLVESPCWVVNKRRDGVAA